MNSKAVLGEQCTVGHCPAGWNTAPFIVSPKNKCDFAYSRMASLPLEDIFKIDDSLSGDFQLIIPSCQQHDVGLHYDLYSISSHPCRYKYNTASNNTVKQINGDYHQKHLRE
jgi:hypothetical protein